MFLLIMPSSISLQPEPGKVPSLFVILVFQLSYSVQTSPRGKTSSEEVDSLKGLILFLGIVDLFFCIVVVVPCLLGVSESIGIWMVMYVVLGGDCFFQM
jgi:hypothetical protein